MIKINNTIIAIIALGALSACYLNDKNTINSDEDYGFSQNQNDYQNNNQGGNQSNNNIFERKSIVESMQTIDTAPTFVEGSKDIPLARGLKKISDDALDFDSTGGNIVSITYSSGYNLMVVKDFYEKTLPYLGWKNIQKNSHSNLLRFRRDNEKLEIELVSDKENGDMVKFFLEAAAK